MHAGSAGPLGNPVAGGGGGGGGGGAYGPPWHTGLVGWEMHRGSSGPVGGPGGCSGTGAIDVPPKAGIAIAEPAAPVAATTMSAPARAPFAMVLQTREALVQLIIRSSVRPGKAMCRPMLLTPKHIRPRLLPGRVEQSHANSSKMHRQQIGENCPFTSRNVTAI